MTDTVEQVIERWTNAEEIRLRAGEIDPKTMRDILAVMCGFASQVFDAHNSAIEDAYDKGKEDGRMDEFQMNADLENFK